ncbi:MAG TPA: hypothetical protein VIM18_06815 [Solirubrobacteraceae bacterium]
MEFLLLLAILFAVAFIVTGPLRRARAQAGDFKRESALAELDAAREAKYREIRDTQLDFDTGKLSREDFEALDTGLRSEALQILEQIDRLRPPAYADRAEAGPREAE